MFSIFINSNPFFMKKLLLITFSAAIVALSVAVTAKFTVTDNLLKANIEALADDPLETEVGEGMKCYNSITTADGRQVLYCGSCQWVSGKPTLFSGSGTCSGGA